MDIGAIEDRRQDAELRRQCLDVGIGRRNGFLHDVFQIASDLHQALARHLDGFNGENVTAEFRPGQTGDDTDLIDLIGCAIVILLHAGIFGETLIIDGDRGHLFTRQVTDRLSRQVAQFTLQRTHAGFPRIVADQVTDGVFRHHEFFHRQAMFLHQVWQDVTLGDLDLFILGIAGDADNLHPVEQRLRHVQAVGRGNEHDFR